MATRSQLVTRVLRNIDREVDTDLTNQARAALDQSIRDWARTRPWYGLQRRIRMPATGTRHLLLPSYVERPISIFDVTNSHPIIAGGNWDDQYPAALAAGTAGRAYEWKDIGAVPTVTEPSGRIVVFSSAAVDSATVRVVGFTAAGATEGDPLHLKVAHESLTLNGQTPVTSTGLFAEILSISKGEDTNGDLTFQDATSGVPIARMGIYDNETRYIRLEMIRPPLAGTVLEVEALTRPVKLVDDDQAPHPSISDDFLEWNAAGLVLVAVGERQAGFTFTQKARAILDAEDYREQAFGDQFLRIQPIYDSFREEENVE